MTADIGRDVMFAKLLLDEFHRRKNRALRTAGAEPGRPCRHDLGESLDLRVTQDRCRIGHGRLVAEELAIIHFDEALQPLHHHRGRIFPTERQDILAMQFRLDIAAAHQRMERLLDIFRRAFLYHDHGLLAETEIHDLLVNSRIATFMT